MKKPLLTSALALAACLAGHAQTGVYVAGPVANWGSASHGVGTGAAAFVVAATGSYTATTGATDSLYNGGANAEIAGATGPLFFNARFGIGAASVLAISNTGGATINGTLTWTHGLTTTVRSNTTTGALRFSSGAGYTATINDARYVDGYVTKTGTTTFTYPVGQGADLRALAASAPTNAATISTAWLVGNPSSIADPTDPSGSQIHSVSALGPGLSSVSAAGQWDWVPVVAPTNALTVNVSIPDVSNTLGNTTNLRLAGWNGSQWINLSTGTGTASANGNVENSILTGVVPAGNAITALAVGAANLPDLTPGIELPFNNFASGQSRQFLVTMQELNSVSTATGVTQFQVTIPTGYSIGFDGTQTSATVSGLGTVVVDNANWTVVATTLGGRRLTLQAKAGVSVGAAAIARIGFTATRTAATAGSYSVITVNVVDNAAQNYDSNTSNNGFGTPVTAD